MKKGFTIVEIIISISIILIVGVSTTFFIFNNKGNKNLESVTKEILDAAKLYVNKEVDKKGNNYVNEVLNGKKGVKIPLSNLVEKGYIDKKIVSNISNYLNYEVPENEDYFVMFIEGTGEEENYCDDGSSYLVASWTMVHGSPIYLCDSSNIASGSNSCPTFIDELRGFYYDSANNEISCGNKNPVITELNEITERDYIIHFEGDTEDQLSCSGKCTYANVEYSYISTKSNGLHKRKGEHSEDIWYYRGKVMDNYVKIINFDGTDDACSYRILSFNNYEIRLIADGYACQGLSMLAPISPSLDDVRFAGCYEVENISYYYDYDNGSTFSFNLVDTWITDGGTIRLSDSNKVVFNENYGNSKYWPSYLKGIIGSVPSFMESAMFDFRFVHYLSEPIKMDMVSGNGNRDNPYIIDFSKQNN